MLLSNTRVREESSPAVGSCVCVSVSKQGTAQPSLSFFCGLLNPQRRHLARSRPRDHLLVRPTALAGGNMSSLSLPRRSSRTDLPSAKSLDSLSLRTVMRSTAYSSSPLPPHAAAPYVAQSRSYEVRPPRPDHVFHHETQVAPLAGGVPHYCSAAAALTMAPPMATGVPRYSSAAAQATTVQLSFEVRCITNWGDTAAIVGSCEQLGRWQPLAGARMQTDESSYPIWSASISLDCRDPAISSSGGILEYKVVILRLQEDGQIECEWESLPTNRSLHITPGVSRCLCTTWNDPSVVNRAGTAAAPVARMTPVAQQAPAASALASQRAPPVSSNLASSASLSSRSDDPSLARRRNTPTSHGSSSARRPSLEEVSVPITAPRPNDSFSVLPNSSAGGKGHGGDVMLGTGASSPQVHFHTTSGYHGLESRVTVGGPLEAIKSMDMSWPPSLSASEHSGSQKSLHNSASETSIHGAA